MLDFPLNVAPSPISTMTGPGIDIIFLQDTTGSQARYISAVQAAINGICSSIQANPAVPSTNVRFGLIAFRDHPPQDITYVTKNFGFTSSIAQMERNLADLAADATGGGDAPEAVTPALAEALDMRWYKEATKMVVLVTDCGPHGIGISGDTFPEKDPGGHDPLQVARRMAEKGITLFVIGCEPCLGGHKNAVDFYKALATITGGRLFSLSMNNYLAEFISGTAVESLETDKLVKEYSAEIVDGVYVKYRSVDEVTAEVHKKLQERGLKASKLKADNLYDGMAKDENVLLWQTAENITDGLAKVSELGEPRPYDFDPSTMDGYDPEPMLSYADIELIQTRRIVVQSLMRASTVTATGIVKKSNLEESKEVDIEAEDRMLDGRVESDERD